MIEVALFPIPDVVAFPGTVLPLHVFEPRYRKMIHDCVRDDRMIAVSHVLKTIHKPTLNKPSRRDTLEERLSSNQATYKPRGVFSAGHCEVVDTTPDGRILAKVAMSSRLSLVDELQSLPYRIVSCISVDDDDGPNPRNGELQHSINNRLIELVGSENPDMIQTLQDPEWIALEAADYSFKVFQFLHFDADTMQSILETQSANTRLEIIWDLLRHSR